ncbi:hypothetical protein ACWGI8_00270 [Streptomyces sp. NPDC054841]
MAAQDNSPALPAPAHPMAKPGYGKRTAPGQVPRRKGDFDHLPAREAEIAAFIDRLPEGAAIDIKTLARELPRYGQQAVTKALGGLAAAGHLRRVRESVGEGLSQWVFRTYFTRTARDSAWWARFVRGDVPPEEATPETPETTEPPSQAYDTLARAGQTDPRMTLSAAECDALEALAAQWLAHGATPDQLLHALTSGLPEQVHSAGAFARRRLIAKMPPPAPVRPRRRTLVECTECGVPGTPEALPDGVCDGCRVPLEPGEVRRRVAALRGELSPSRFRTGTGTPPVEACRL